MTPEHFVHTDSIQSKRLSLALNAPVVALSGNRFQRSGELTRWFKSSQEAQGLGAVLIDGDLAWGTEDRAVVVGAQVMAWPLMGGVATLVWPLDDGVYIASITDAEGEVSVVAGSETVWPVDDALARIEQIDDRVIVDGGFATSRFRDAGYKISEEHTLSTTRAVSRARLGAYTRKGFPHIAHAVIVISMIAAGYAGYVLDKEAKRRATPIREVVTLPPQGSPQLREDLYALARLRQQVEALQIYGLKNVLYESESRRVTLIGEFNPGHMARLRTWSDALNGSLAMLQANWRMTLRPNINRAQTRDLFDLEAQLALILSVLTTKTGWYSTIESYVDGGSPLSLDGGLRLLSRDYTEANIGLVIEREARPLAALLDVIDRMPKGVNGRLGEVLLEFDQGSLISARLNFVVRGEKVTT